MLNYCEVNSDDDLTDIVTVTSFLQCFTPPPGSCYCDTFESKREEENTDYIHKVIIMYTLTTLQSCTSYLYVSHNLQNSTVSK